jgi:hypothetical protein
VPYRGFVLPLTPVRRDALRRWAVVGVGMVALCLLPVAVAAWPVGTAARVEPVELRDRILGSTAQPHDGYVETDGRLGLPDLPALAEVGGLLGGSTRLRTWYAGPESWRVAELAPVGERDTYRVPSGVYTWDFERNLVTLITGDRSVWLPGAADIVPPALARRLLAADGDLQPLPSRRVAGVAAAGVRLVITDPATTVGRVDAWADPETGLPVQVEVAGRGAAGPAFSSRFLQLRQDPPDPRLLLPRLPRTAGLTVTTNVELEAALTAVLPGDLPGTLAGRPRSLVTVEGAVAAGYGTGFSTMMVIGLPGRFGGQTLDAAEAAGTPIPITGAEAYELRASLLTALVVHADHTEPRREELHAWLLAGLVEPQLLRQAATELVGSVS